MRILYLSLSYIPSRRASSVQVMRMCAALARAGHEVTLLAKANSDASAAPDASDATGRGGDHAFYGVPAQFELRKLPRPRRRGGGVLFSAAMAAQLWKERRRAELVYSRDLLGAWMASQARLPVVFEAHSIPSAPALRRLWRSLMASPRLRRLVVISEALRRDLEAEGMLPRRGSVVVAHDAADAPEVAPARAGEGGAARIGYVGSLYPGRGIELILALAAKMPALRFEIIGGSEADLARWRPQLPGNARLHGFVAPGALAARYAELDVLLMPYARSGVGGPLAKVDTSRWCSPMKMFEYMASGAPIVSSDLAVLQEVLRHDRNALIAPVDDPAAWQRAIERLVAEPATRARLAAQALRDLRAHYTWDARAAAVLRGL
jgi:glycosyltransferase involved in cell wall biosynthesis